MRLSLLFLLTVGAACSDGLDYGAVDQPDDAAPLPDAARPADRPGLVVAPTKVNQVCEVQAALEREDLEFDNDVVVDAARVEDTVDANGALTSRVLRGDGWQRDELFGPDGCLGILTLQRFNAQGEPLVREVVVLDGELAFALSPYGGLISSLSTWRYDARGHLVRWEVDGQVVEYTRDEAGNAVREDAPYGDERLVTARVFDADGQLLSEKATAGDVELWRVENVYDGAGRPLSAVRTQTGRVAHVRWEYDGDRLTRRVSREDWSGDGHPEREDVNTFDAEGRKIGFTQDQPYDGRLDWRETFELDADGNVLRHQGRNLASDELMIDVRYEYEDGLEVLEVQLDGRRQETEYDGDGRATRTAWFRPGGALQTQSWTEYAPVGTVVRQAYDNDGDGAVDSEVRQSLDRAGQPVLTSSDWGADGVPETSVLRLWR